MFYQRLRESTAHAPDMQWQATRTPRDAITVAARSFYTDVLDGQQVWPDRPPGAAPSLWFLVGTTLLEVTGADALPVVLEVDEPEEIAERCWNAGFPVHIRDEADGASILSVTDPFGRRIELAPSVPARHAGARRS
jgi:catechol 2,3-dioxygenase-like lactoylglutathione lyase family enzyme